jgi:hypothetical protein
MRELTSHRGDVLNDVLRIEVLDEPGQDNACHVYRISMPNGTQVDRPVFSDVLEFQNGSIYKVGIYGISDEALLAVLEDRLQGFQSGPNACSENRIALAKIKDAMMWLKRRRDRMTRLADRNWHFAKLGTDT